MAKTKKKLTSKKEASPTQKEVQKWLERIGRATKVRKAWREKFRVDLSYEYFEGVWIPQRVAMDEWININKVYSYLMAELPSLYGQDPDYYVKVKRSFSADEMTYASLEAQAGVRQAVLNYLKTELDMKKKSRLSICDAEFQYGVVKVGFEPNMTENPNAGLPVLGEDGEAMFNGDEAIIEPDELPSNPTFIIKRIHPDDYMVDEDAGPLDTTWQAERVRRRLEDVQKDKRYNASARNKIKATEKSTEEKAREERKKGGEIGSLDGKQEEKPDIVVLWEVWDTESKEFLVVSEGCPEEFLIDPQAYPPGIEDDPFVSLRYVMRDDSWYPLPPMSQLLDPQKEYSMTRSKILAHRKRFNRKYEAYLPGFDDPEMALSKLEVGEDGTVLGKNVQQACVTPIQDAPLDMGVHTELAYMERDFQNLAMGANQTGSGTAVDSATEAGIIEKRAVIREGDKAALVSDFLAQIGRKLDMLVQANLTESFAIKVTGLEGETWQEVRPQDYQQIYGEFETTVVVGSHIPQTPEIERAQALNFLGLLAQAPQLAMSQQLMLYIGKLFSIEERQLKMMIQELQQVVQAMAQGALPPAGGMGSQPGVGESRAQSALPGAALGHSNIRGGMQ